MNHFTVSKLKKVMEHCDLNQSDMARLLGVHKTYICQVLSGKAPITIQLQKRLNRVFKHLTDEHEQLKSVRKLKEIIEETGE